MLSLHIHASSMCVCVCVSGKHKAGHEADFDILELSPHCQSADGKSSNVSECLPFFIASFL